MEILTESSIDVLCMQQNLIRPSNDIIAGNGRVQCLYILKLRNICSCEDMCPAHQDRNLKQDKKLKFHNFDGCS